MTMGVAHVKLARLSFLFGVVALAMPAPGRAQPVTAQGMAPIAGDAQRGVVDAPNEAGGENMPWNRGVSLQTRAEARATFLEGNRLFKIPLFSQAVEKYADAIEKWKHPAFYFNLAIAQINLNLYLEARDNLEQALKYGEAPLRADRFLEAKKQLLEVQRHLARIRVRCPTPGAEISLDGVMLFTAPGDHEVWVKAQAHEVTVRKSEYGTQVKRVKLAAGAQQTVDVSLRKIIEDRPWAVWKPWAVVGAGAAIAAAGGVMHALSARDFNTYDERFVALPCAMMGCTGRQINDTEPQLGARLDRARLEQRIAIGGYVIGGAVLAAGVALVYLNRPHLMEREGDEPPARGISMLPVVSADSVGVLVTVRP